MKFVNSIILISSVITSYLAALAPLYVPADAIEGEYIIMLDGLSRSGLDSHLTKVKNLLSGRADIGSIKYVYNFIGSSYSAKFSDLMLAKVRAMPEVKYIEQDAISKISTVQSDSTWGLNRISQRAKVAEKGPYKYTYDGDGSGVSVYVIDTGIYTQHPEFEGRARHGASFPPGLRIDDHGHGTHCAGTVGSKTYGVAKKVSLVAVKVLNALGSGTNSNIIAGINWAVNDKKGTKGNVLSMSLGGGRNQAINDAVNSAYNKGFVAVVAAGNDNQDACRVSPASTPNAVTVAASDIRDVRASFSNYGRCTDIFAPGVNILSTWNNGGTRTLNGTSMATPHVAGLAAYYLSKSTLTNQQLVKKLIDSATTNVITSANTGTPNRLAFNSAA